MSLDISQLTAEQRSALVGQLLQDQSTRESVGIKYAPRSRVGVSEKMNLLFNDQGYNGALGKDEKDGHVYYMARVARNRNGSYSSNPYPATLAVSKDAIVISVTIPLKTDYERNLYNEWAKGTAKPTIFSQKPAGQTAPAPTIPTASAPAQVTSTPSATTTPVQVSQTTGATLNPVQRTVLKKLLEMQAYPNEQDAMTKFNEWKDMKPKDLE